MVQLILLTVCMPPEVQPGRHFLSHRQYHAGALAYRIALCACLTSDHFFSQAVDIFSIVALVHACFVLNLMSCQV